MEGLKFTMWFQPEKLCETTDISALTKLYFQTESSGLSSSYFCMYYTTNDAIHKEDKMSALDGNELPTLQHSTIRPCLI